jgi:uncharacterized membrane protein YgdD (TMEM256/DUF423 family)
MRAIALAGLLGTLGVLIGAFGAHGLEGYLKGLGLEAANISKRLSQCDVAVRYHLVHTLAIFAAGVYTSVCGTRLTWSVLFWFLGICLFSGGLYSMVFLGQMGHWAIVPGGGLCFVLGWLGLMLHGLTQPD